MTGLMETVQARATLDGPRAIYAATAHDVVAIVSTFNRADLLKETLTSLLAQTVRPGRILVVDDGSADHTRSVVESFGGAVDYRFKPNGGKAAALNMALAATTEPLVWIFDDDDLADPEALERLTAALASRPDCGMAYGVYENFEVDPATGADRRWSVGAPVVDEAALFPALLERCFIFQGAMLVRRSCYEAVGGFDEALLRSQDYDMLLRLNRRFSAVRVDKTLFYQRQHAGPRGTAANPIRREQMEEAWRRYDRAIFSKIRAEVELQEYLPRGVADAEAPAARRAALLQRFVVFARKDMWAEAEEDLKAFFALVAETGDRLGQDEYGMLARVFDGYSRGLAGFGTAGVRRELKAVKAAGLKSEIAAALATPLPYRLKLAAQQHSNSDFKQALRAVFNLGALPVARSLLRKKAWGKAVAT